MCRFRKLCEDCVPPAPSSRPRPDATAAVSAGYFRPDAMPSAPARGARPDPSPAPLASLQRPEPPVRPASVPATAPAGARAPVPAAAQSSKKRVRITPELLDRPAAEVAGLPFVQPGLTSAAAPPAVRPRVDAVPPLEMSEAEDAPGAADATPTPSTAVSVENVQAAPAPAVPQAPLPAGANHNTAVAPALGAAGRALPSLAGVTSGDVDEAAAPPAPAPAPAPAKVGLAATLSNRLKLHKS